MSPIFPYELAPPRDPIAVTLEKRLYLARVFIAGTLLPTISDLPPDIRLTDEEIKNLVKKFRTEHQGQGDDFKMSHIKVAMGIMYVDYLLSEVSGNRIPDHDLIKKAYDRMFEYKRTLE